MTITPENANWIITAWMSVIGGVIGSFLNVVVYRLPLGISLVEPGSHCPKCKHPIRWFDNVPVFGWIMLRGKCRDCGNPISIRYPVVEALTALMFGLMTSYEFLAEGRNLPLRQIEVAPAVFQSGLNMYEMFAVLLFHLLLLCTLLCTALIEHDGQRPPLKLFLPALVVGLAAPLWWPWLRPMPWEVLPPMPALSVKPCLLMGAVDGLLGLSAGAAIGAAGGGLIWWALRRQQKPQGLLCAAASVGLFLGWQAVAAVVVAALAVYTINWIPRRVIPKMWQIPATVWLLTATLIGILFSAHIATCS